VVLLPEHDKAADDLADLGLALFVVDHRSLDGILDSFRALGGRCGIEERARALVREFHALLKQAEQRAKGKPRPSVLITVGREIGSGSLGQVYAAGTGSFYDPLIERAGGTNACREGATRFPALSAEGILRMNPDVIVELVPDFEEKGLTREAVFREWRKAVPHVRAVKNGRLHVFTEDYTVIPGPRLVLLVERLAEVLHLEGEDRPR
jgi:iron complex transport system substrate-binding protein